MFLRECLDLISMESNLDGILRCFKIHLRLDGYYSLFYSYCSSLWVAPNGWLLWFSPLKYLTISVVRFRFRFWYGRWARSDWMSVQRILINALIIDFCFGLPNYIQDLEFGYLDLSVRVHQHVIFNLISGKEDRTESILP